MKGLTSSFVMLLAMTSVLMAQGPAATPIQGQNAPVNAIYSKLPLIFEANQGQAGGNVKFLTRTTGYTAFLTSGGIQLSLRNAPTARSSTVPPNLQFRLVGANSNPAVIGEAQQPGIVNYFMGKNPSQWHTRVATYARVRYKNVYPGIDLIYYGNNQQLEYDFDVSAGANAALIQLEILGAQQTSVDADGNLVVNTAAGDLRFQSPVVYQESNGQRIPLNGSYAVKDSTHVGFQLQNYDSSKPVVIDPVLTYSTYLGGSGSDVASGIAVDASGNVYVTGYTTSSNFPLATDTLPPNTNHVFVAKLNSTGSGLIYADYIGGSSEDYGIALVLDGANDVYVTGSTQSNNFPVVNAFQAQQPGPYSGFLTKVSADGASLMYSTYLGGSTFDQPTSIAIDSFGQAHVAGYTLSQNFPVAHAYQSTASANQDGLYGTYGFLTKFSADGSALQYSTYFAGNSNVVQDCGSPCWPSPFNMVSAIALDSNDNAYVTGSTNTYNFPTTTGAYLTTNTTQQDVTISFASKFSSAGSLDYSTYFYGSGGYPVSTAAIAVDGSGDAYISGTAFSDGTFPITSTSICDPGVYGFGCSYAFVTKFDPAAATLLYSTFLGPNNYASPYSMALDASNDAYVLTSSNSAAFTTTNAIEAYTGGADLLLVEVDPSASTQLMSTFLGGSADETPAGIAVDAAGNVYVGGWSNSSDFPTTPGAFQTATGGGVDTMIAKISSAAAAGVSFSPAALQFGTVQVGSSSSPQTVLLRNMGSASLAITSITSTGDFSQTNDCGSSVPAAGSCTISITFTPTAGGNRTGSVVLKDNAAGSQQQVSLTGTGAAANVLLSPASLSFTSLPIGNASAAQTVTLTNNGTAVLQVNSISVSGGDYSQTNNCPSVMAYGASCTISVVFTPTASGTRTGTITVTDNAQNAAQTLGLSGIGSDFSLSSTPGSNTVKAGSTATYTITVSPVGGTFGNAVTLNCSGGLPANATCKFSPASASPGTNGTTSTLTITTASTNSANTQQGSGIVALWMQLPGFGLIGMVLAGSRRRQKWLRFVVLVVVLACGVLSMTGCAGGTGIAQQTGTGSTGSGGTTYTITVSGASGTLQHSVAVSLTVQ